MKKLINLIFVFTLLFLVSCNKEKNTKTDIVPVEKPKDSIVQVEKKIVENTPELIFTVQIGAFKKPNQKMAGVTNIKVTKEEDLYKYRLGSFTDYKSARSFRKRLSKEYPGAFVQALKKNNPINIIKALK